MSNQAPALPGLTLAELPAGSPNLYLIHQDGRLTGVGTPDEIRDLVDDRTIPADGLTFTLELAA
ncbi:MAG TPA: hypothetical protein VGF77_13345 [Allosphingosinicella sp.]|jgi:hypothetical protein